MSIQSINRGSGHYTISTGFEETDLRALAVDSSTKYIQFSTPLSNDEIDLLEKVIFSQRGGYCITDIWTLLHSL
ncbi:MULTISPECIES: hypothetical protein [Sphingobacterium]|uniref:hypothetical protein n=1 Tax=Sphingobacterium TaxID=28453 RepID=UPI0025810ACD|nr:MULTISPECIES: hypothetical protein [Sphingobacterium]